MAKFLHFFTQYNTIIIEVLVALVLGLMIFLVFQNIFGKKETMDHGEHVPLPADLENTLKKVLENIPQAPAASSGNAGVDPALLAARNAELEKLRLEIAAKEKELAAEKARAAQAASAGAPAAAANAEAQNGLSAKIKDLEARLAEYEIISEDIADLSFYKEENARLQAELKQSKGGAGTEVATPPPTAAPETISVPPENAPAAAPQLESVTPTPEPAATSVTPEPPPAAAAVIQTESAPAAGIALDNSQPPPAGTQDGPVNVTEEDLMKEFAAAVAEQKSATSDEGKVAQVGGTNTVATSNDASAGTSAAAPPPANLNDESQLMNQFENFVKKG